MGKMFKSIGAILILLFLFFFSALGAMEYSEIISQKMKMEDLFQKQVERVLGKMIGEGKYSVLVTIEPDIEKSTTQTETWATNRAGSAGDALSEAEKNAKLPRSQEFLPGIPFKKDLIDKEDTLKESKKEEDQSLGMKKSVELVSNLPKSFIKSLSVIVVLDRKVKESTVETIKSVITELLSINPQRGDKLIVRQEKFIYPVGWSSFLGKWQFYVMMTAILLSALLLWYGFNLLKKFFFSIADILKESRGAETAAAVPDGYGLAEGEVQDTLTEEEVEIEEKQKLAELKPKEEVKEMELEPFKYLQDKDLKYFMYLIKDLSPEKIAAILGYLDSAKSAKMLESLPEELQLKVVINMIRVQEMSEELLIRIDHEVKDRLDNIVGGMDKFVDILNMLDSRARDGLMELIEKQNPNMAQKIKERVFTFEQIEQLEATSLRIILGEVNTGELAVALRKASEGLRKKIMSNLSEGGVALLREEMEFGKPATDAKIIEEQAKIVGVIHRLEEEGKIAIGKESLKKVLEEEEYLKEKKIVIGEAKKGDKQKNKAEENTQERENDKAFDCYNSGIEAYGTGDTDGAIKSFEESLDYNPNIWQTYQYLGNCYYGKGMQDRAIESYENALKLNPENTELSEWLKAHIKA